MSLRRRIVTRLTRAVSPGSLFKDLHAGRKQDRGTGRRQYSWPVSGLKTWSKGALTLIR